MNVALDSPWNFPNIPDEIGIPCSNTGFAAFDESNCGDMVNIIDYVANESMDEIMDSVSVIQENETAILGALPYNDSSVKDLLSIDNSSVVQMQKDSNKDNEQYQNVYNNEKTKLEYT